MKKRVLSLLLAVLAVLSLGAPALGAAPEDMPISPAGQQEPVGDPVETDDPAGQEPTEPTEAPVETEEPVSPTAGPAAPNTGDDAPLTLYGGTLLLCAGALALALARKKRAK